MKISYNWLKEFVDINLDAQALADALSMVGFEVDAVITNSLEIDNVVVGRVLQREPHPDADKLSVCTVDVGEDAPLSIICGAPNVAAGQIVPVAKIGAALPNGMVIRKAKIRGVYSHGMICSEEELGLAEKSGGIWVLPDHLAVGAPLAAALAYETDYILDIGVTPNRPDALCHIGFAREVAAIAGTSLHIPTPEFTETTEDVQAHLSVEIHCPDSCPRYTGRLVRNLKPGPSPAWLARRLKSVGMRPINNIVDITNYVMLETGQPLHAFDYQLIAGGKIIVRESREGETFVTLDGKTHTLKSGTVLICDAEKPVALGGIMGGLNSEVNDNTTDVLLEAAYFQPENIQRSLRYLGMNSEAAMRFERGIDPNNTLHAQRRAMELLSQYAGGEIAAGVVDAYPKKIYPVAIELKTGQINRLLGTNLTADEMADLLKKIEIPVEGGRVIAPTFRPDLTRVADVAEEVARLYGYDNIPLCTKTPLSYEIHANPFDDFIDELKTILTGVGLQEVITNSLVSIPEFEKITGKPVYPILNPISQDMNGLRNHLIPGLLSVLRWNVNRQTKDLAIFEVNRVFHHPGSVDVRPREEMQLAIALTGKRGGDHWTASGENFDFYDIKGLVEYLRDKISLDTISFIPYSNFLVEDQSVKLTIGKTDLGYCGKLKDSLRKLYDIDHPVYVAQLSVPQLFKHRQPLRELKDLPRFPWVDRDVALVFDRHIEAEKVLQTVRNAGGPYLQSAYIFDVYTGKQVPADKKSVAFRLIFQSMEKTLTEEVVNKATENILRAVEKTYNATLRS